MLSLLSLICKDSFFLGIIPFSINFFTLIAIPHPPKNKKKYNKKKKKQSKATLSPPKKKKAITNYECILTAYVQFPDMTSAVNFLSERRTLNTGQGAKWPTVTVMIY